MKNVKLPTKSPKKQAAAKMLKEKETELAKLRRELEIEAALESIRARALAMLQSDELNDVVSLVFEKLRELNVAMDSACILTFTDDMNGHTAWAANPDLFSVSSVYVPYHEDPISTALYTARKQGKDFIDKSWNVDDKNLHWKYLFQHTDYKLLSDQLKQAVFDFGGWAFTGPFYKNSATLLVGYTQTKVSKPDKDIIKRIGRVFEQAYIRFLDLKKAESQAYEARIQTALERVRSSAMEMHSSNGLSKVAEVLREQMALLGQKELESCLVQLYDKGSNMYTAYYSFKMPDASDEKLVHDVAEVPWKETAWSRKVISQYESGADTFSIHAKKSMLEEWYAMLAKVSPRTVEYDSKNVLQVPDELYYYFACFSGGFLTVISYDPPSNEAKLLLNRAANTFDIAYKRYQDLQKAEAQAREAQIEAALERVRARSMAMHTTVELREVISTVFRQLQVLDFDIHASALVLIDKDGSQDTWLAGFSKTILPKSYKIPETNHPYFTHFVKKWKSQIPYDVFKFEGELKKSYDEFVFGQTEFKHLPKKVRESMIADSEMILSAAYMKYGWIEIDSYDPISEEKAKVLQRFAKVFEQTYTRFLDLQKAEAQAREAQIEAALERVRAASLAMHNSEDLQNVVGVLYGQLVELDIQMDAAQIEIMVGDPNAMHVWVANQLQPYGRRIKIPHLNHPSVKGYISARNDKKKEYSATFSKKQKNAFYREAFVKTDLENIPEKRKQQMLAGEGLGIYSVFVKHTATQLINFQGHEYSAEDRSIVRRFADVFEQAYVRFLDIQKAETQTRHAQIEAALERVRSHTMALQKSDELNVVVDVILRELEKLGFNLYDSNIAIFDKESKHLTMWGSEMGNAKLPTAIDVPPFGHPFLEDLYASILSGKEFENVELSGDDLKTYLKALIRETDYKYAPKEYLDVMFSVERIYLAHAFMGHGFIEVASDTPLPTDKADILIRFAKVVDQTYTRFDDLVKAEAQAREAQIEAAMERVRSRSMAMHKSGELEEVITELHQQVLNLQIHLDDSSIITNSELNNPFEEFIMWRASISMPQAKKYRSKVFDHPIHLKNFDARTKNITFHTERYSKKYKDDYFKRFFDQPDFKDLPAKEKQKIFNGEAYIRSTVITKKSLLIFQRYSDLEFTAEENEIFKRFGKVFEQTYTRFLDLQKAEAQARESEIQLSLERVRAKAMSMHNTNDISAATAIVFNELKRLGVEMDRCGIGLFYESSSVMEVWSTLMSQKNKTVTKVIKGELDLTLHPMLQHTYDAWKAKKDYFCFPLIGDELRKYYGILEKVPEYRFPKVTHFPEKQIIHCFYFTEGEIFAYTKSDLSNEQKQILSRFAEVFSLTYRRYLDLKRAEAQAREAQIEAALERVRARGMAMHKTDELQDVIKTVFDQFKNLGLSNQVCIIELFDKESDDMNMWLATAKADYPQLIVIPYFNDPIFNDYNKAKKSKSFLKRSYSKSVKDIYYKHLLNNPRLKNIPSKQRKYIYDSSGYTISGAFTKNAALGMVKYDQIPFAKEEDEILIRFAKVFEQTYTRFLDLQKAEVQAREAQIEAALERVRARSMAMHKSKEINDILGKTFEEFSSLGVQLTRAVILIFHPDDHSFTWWSAQPEAESGSESFEIPDNDNKVYLDYWEAWEKRRSKYYYELSGDAKKDWDDHLFSKTGLSRLPKEVQQGMRDPYLVHLYNSFQEFGCLYIGTLEPLSETDFTVIERFAKVFQQAWTRFIDIKKAESQAREAQIEAALERVRARSMAMHDSSELVEVATVMFDQFEHLGLEHFLNCGYLIIDEEKNITNSWFAQTDQDFLISFALPLKGDWVLEGRYKAWKKKLPILEHIVSGKKLRDHLNVVFPFESRTKEEKMAISAMPDPTVFYTSNFSHGYIIVIAEDKIIESQENILRRFTLAFEQAYTRFLDLQKAEAQAREAQIEAALERIRASALAMHSSDDLINVVDTLRQQMGELGQPGLDSSGIHFYDDERKKIRVWWVFGEVDNPSSDLFKGFSEVDYDSCQYSREVVEHYHSGEKQFQVESSNSKLLEWYKVMREVAPEIIEHDKAGQIITPDKLHYCYSRFSGGALTMASDKPFAEESMKLQIRAAQVFELAYRRFLDLQQAEARAKESIMQASLDRVRGEIASMRSVDDLNRITPLIWTELKTLEVPFIRCGVMIMDEKRRKIQSHLATPEGKTLGIFDLPYDSQEIATKALPKWRKGEIHKDHWNKAQFLKFMNRLLQSGQIKNPESYQGSSAPPESLDLHFVSFKQGMLYVGNTAPLNDESIELVKSLADAFSIAYARYEDFSKLEETKRQIEKALEELKATQSQLIHSEKMASLGELTAGIAHEIQNPLNFVNNFSEVSADLLDELKEEMASGNSEEVLEISKDLVQNLEKIHEHGERASSIVKGMLAHSRTGIKEKEPVDINKLADEYLRLAYHGFRAKDKSFNAQFKTEFDESLPKVRVISQDIGRVLLNLINNAFYIVSKKSEESKDNYRPNVIVKTKKQHKNVLICIQDNGPGIPQDARDKIFQPFFTTKPAGEGTGLGLSLSYDIITQGHDGHLEVETEEGIGTSFIIQLPIV